MKGRRMNRTSPAKGDLIEVYWAGDKRYYPGTVASHGLKGIYRVDYVDGDVEHLNLRQERWRFKAETDPALTSDTSAGKKPKLPSSPSIDGGPTASAEGAPTPPSAPSVSRPRGRSSGSGKRDNTSASSGQKGEGDTRMSAPHGTASANGARARSPNLASSVTQPPAKRPRSSTGTARNSIPVSSIPSVEAMARCAVDAAREAVRQDTSHVTAALSTRMSATDSLVEKASAEIVSVRESIAHVSQELKSVVTAENLRQMQNSISASVQTAADEARQGMDDLKASIKEEAPRVKALVEEPLAALKKQVTDGFQSGILVTQVLDRKVTESAEEFRKNLAQVTADADVLWRQKTTEHLEKLEKVLPESLKLHQAEMDESAKTALQAVVKESVTPFINESLQKSAKESISSSLKEQVPSVLRLALPTVLGKHLDACLDARLSVALNTGIDAALDAKLAAALGTTLPDHLVSKLPAIVEKCVGFPLEQKLLGAVESKLGSMVEKKISEPLESSLLGVVESKVSALVERKVSDALNHKLTAVLEAKLPRLVNDRIANQINESVVPTVQRMLLEMQASLDKSLKESVAAEIQKMKQSFEKELEKFEPLFNGVAAERAEQSAKPSSSLVGVSISAEDAEKFRKEQEDKRVIESLRTRAKEIAGRSATIWLLEDISRSAPPTEPSQRIAWAKNCATLCLQHIAKEINNFNNADDALRILNASLGGELVELDWFVKPCAPNAVEKARLNYSSWDPPLRDDEWIAETNVLRNLSYRFNEALRTLQVRISDSALRIATRAALDATHHS